MKSIISFIDSFLDSGLRSTESPDDFRKSRLMRGATLVFMVLVLSGSVAFFVLDGLNYLVLVFDLLIVFVGTRFLGWFHDKENVGLVSFLYLAFLVVLLVSFALFVGVELWVLQVLVFFPLFYFLVGGVRYGLIWSGVVFVWVIVLFSLSLFRVYGLEAVGFNQSITVITTYLLVVALAYNYEKLRENNETMLRSKNDELLRLIYVISHDLRNPLTSFKGFFSFIKEDIKEKNMELLKKDLKKTELVISSMEQMINELLDLSRIGRGDDALEEADTGKMVKDLLIINESQLKTKGIEVEMLGDFPIIQSNRKKLNEVFRNLLSNAIKYIGETEFPKISIGVNENLYDYNFFVKDNGIGVAKQDYSKIFELFYQGAEATQESSGVGLSVVKGFVADMGGEVWLDSEEGKGSTFWFSLPKKVD